MKPEQGIDPAGAAGSGCPRCGGTDLHDEEISSAYWHEGRLVVVEGIPALVCRGCGERLYADGVVMTLDLMHGGGYPDTEATRHLHVPVFRFGRRGRPAEPEPCQEPDPMRRPFRRRLGIAVVGLTIGSLPVLAQVVFDFMPDGGRTLLFDAVGGSPEALEEVMAASRSEADWSAYFADTALEPAPLETLAGYLAVNMPLAAEGQAAVLASHAAADLPPDGKDLAIANCQFCHSFFTGYLARERDVAGWRSVFKAPFHAELPMTEAERETFARYSAINMPIPFEEVPEDLRF